MNKLKKILICFTLLFSSSLFSHSIADQNLVTIHGILGAPWNMYYLSNGFDKEKVNVLNWGYPSRDKKIQEHAVDLVADLKEMAAKSPGVPINFITHSMGGLILRAAMNVPDCPTEAKIGRAALLAPPNQGASWGRYLAQYGIAVDLAKDFAGKELMTEKDFEHLGQFPDSMQVMVIAGNRSYNPLLPGESDGTVTVEETYLTTPHKHEIIYAGHKTMVLSSEAKELVKKFFEEDL